MKIESLTIYLTKAGWRNWAYLAIKSDGLTGWSEFSDSNCCISSTIQTIIFSREILIGSNINQYIASLSILKCRLRQNLASSTKALAALENALIDLRCKSLGIPAYELLGGAVHQPLPYYWSHFGTTRVRAYQECLLPALTSHEQLYDLVQMAVSEGTRTFKSNICALNGAHSLVYMPGSGKGIRYNRPTWTESCDAVRLINSWLETCYKAAPQCSFAIDLNYNLPGPLLKQLPISAAWYELDLDSCHALSQQRSVFTVITGENILELDQQASYMSSQFVDIMSVDPAWLSWSRLSSAITLSNLYNKPLTLHNYNSHLSTAMAYSYGQLIPNLHYIELDLDDVPWKDDIVDALPVLSEGHVTVRSGPGWGVNILLAELKPYILHEY